MNCPNCNETGSLFFACWVSSKGEVIETCGDANTPDKYEPPQAALCGECGKYFSPPDGYTFTVPQGEGRPRLYHSASGTYQSAWPEDSADGMGDAVKELMQDLVSAYKELG